MNVIDRQTELTKSLYSINSAALKEFASQQKVNVEKYIETNKSFGEKLPEIKGVTEFFSLQREYGESLWANAKTAFEIQNDLVKGAFEETRDAFKVALATEDTLVEKVEEKVEAAAVKAETVAVKAETVAVKAETGPAKVATKAAAKAKPKAKKVAK
ncbi:MAG: hypothetical protein ACJAVI_005514 [Candidatus Azotimanducaceae bacterium]|jgi:hypothetical protein